MKKVMKILGIIMIFLVALVAVFLIYAAIKNYKALHTPLYEDNYYENFSSEGRLEKLYAGIGSYEVAYQEIKTDNKSIKNIRIWYPSEMDTYKEKYPLVMVVNASQTTAEIYKPFFKRLASWGFIVVGNDDPQTGTGDTASETLDYMLKESFISDRIDIENMGIIGYSQGGAGALAALTEHENGKLYKTIFTGSAAYPFLAGNFGWKYTPESINVSYFMTAGTGKTDDMNVADIGKEYGGVAPLQSLVQIYDEMSDDVLKVRARSAGSEHEQMLEKTDGYMTAWLLYQLKGDEQAGSAFTGENAEIMNNASWQDVMKNDLE